jgi:hypothetical protein
LAALDTAQVIDTVIEFIMREGMLGHAGVPAAADGLSAIAE